MSEDYSGGKGIALMFFSIVVIGLLVIAGGMWIAMEVLRGV